MLSSCSVVLHRLLPYPAYTLGAPKKPSEGAADSSSLDRKAASPLQGSLPVNFGELMHLQELCAPLDSDEAARGQSVASPGLAELDPHRCAGTFLDRS